MVLFAFGADPIAVTVSPAAVPIDVVLTMANMFSQELPPLSLNRALFIMHFPVPLPIMYTAADVGFISQGLTEIAG
jgi:hypothetical protein